MKNYNDILEELKQLNSPLADMSRTMPYFVPQGYFESFSNNSKEVILLCEQEDPLLHYPKTIPFVVPYGYFEQLPASILGTTEYKLNLPKQNAFATPQGYFENLPLQILETVKAEEKLTKPKTISFRPSVWKMTRWAAAALLVLGLGIGSYRFLVNSPIPNTQKELAALPHGTVSDYIQQNIDDFDNEMIESNLLADNHDLSPVNTNNLSKDEITQYLDETGWDKTEIN